MPMLLRAPWEPILLIGVPEAKLHGFNTRYAGVGVNQRVVVSHSQRSGCGHHVIDAITGRQSPPWWVNEIVMHAAHKVALSPSLVEKSGAEPKPAMVRAPIVMSPETGRRSPATVLSAGCI